MKKYTKQKDGRYRASVSLGTYDANGRPVKKYVSAKTIRELEEKIEKLRADIRDQMNIIENDITFGRYAQKWFATYKAAKGVRTQEMYDRILKHHLTELEDIPMNKLNRMNVQSLINSKLDYPRTCEQVLLTVKQICKSAVNDGLIRRNPCTDIELPRHVKEERRALTEEERQAIKAAPLSERERAYVSVLLGTGMRPAEMYALVWSDIDFVNCTISINKALTFENDFPQVTYPKTNSSIRQIQSPDFVFKDLQTYKSKTKNNSVIVFAAKSGGYKGKQRYHEEWQRIKKKIVAVLGHDTDITPYYFRHNFATQCYYSGITLLECQRILGHSSHEMIMRTYAHLDEQKENTRSKLNSINF